MPLKASFAPLTTATYRKKTCSGLKPGVYVSQGSQKHPQRQSASRLFENNHKIKDEDEMVSLLN